MNHELTPDEQAIEDEADQLVSVDATDRAEVEAIIARARKNRSITLRVSEFDLALVKRRAANEGMPYQTLINRILRKYVTDQLCDREELRKILSEAMHVRGQ